MSLASQHYGSARAVDADERAVRQQRRAARLRNIRAHQQRVEDAHAGSREREVRDRERRVRTLIAQRLDYYGRLKGTVDRDRSRLNVYNDGLFRGWQ